MRRASRGTIWLDYADAGRKRKFPPNVSAVAVAGNNLWTASDEMRRVECLEPNAEGYRLHRQFKLDELFSGLSGAEKVLEADVGALDVAHGRLWVRGSHSLTRGSRDKTDATVDPRIRERPSRRLLGSVELRKDGGDFVAPGKALAYDGAGSLRAMLGSLAHIAPFMDLPSKENGLDIEGLVTFRRKVYVGMRGPVVDNIALVAAIGLTRDFSGPSDRKNKISFRGRNCPCQLPMPHLCHQRQQICSKLWDCEFPQDDVLAPIHALSSAGPSLEHTH